MKFINSFWSVNIISGGFLLLAVLLYLLPNEKSEVKDSEYFSFKLLFKNINKNKYKYAIYILVFTLSGYLWGSFVSKEKYSLKRYRDIIINDKLSYDEDVSYYNNLLLSTTNIYNEISEYYNFFDNLDKKNYNFLSRIYLFY